MLDTFFLPNSERTPNSDIQTFVGRLETTSNANPPATECFIWKKPRGVTMTHILAIGAGAGGGGGATGSASTARAGGGGGGSGALSTLIIPVIYLPDKLYVFPGLGGVGGVATVNGVQGTETFVLVDLDPNFSIANTLLRAGGCQSTAAAGVGNAGGGGSSSGGSASGTIANCPWAQYGVLSSIAGNKGGSGGLTGNPGGAGGWTQGQNFIMGAGGGGGATTGTNGNGGTQSLASTSTILGPISEANPSAATNGAGGSSGMVLRSPIYPLFVFAGNGGAGDDTTTGGNGGNGIWGSGGGGGGAGTTGGNGGNGGSGAVIITCW